MTLGDERSNASKTLGARCVQCAYNRSEQERQRTNGVRMNEYMKRHVPIIVVVSIVCAVSAAFVLMYLHGAAADMSLDAFSLAVFVVPCIAMVVASLVIVATSSFISRQLYVVALGICLAAGVVAMVVTSSWFQDPALTAALLANSPDGTEVTIPLRSPLIVLRDIAAYVVAPTVGCIAGAWIGSRLHPMERVK